MEPFRPASRPANRSSVCSRPVHRTRAAAQQDHSSAAGDAQIACSRRGLLASAPASLAALTALVSSAAAAPPAAWAAENAAVVQGLNKYIKRKQLDPLGTYVPLLLEARDQLIRVGRVMLQDADAARSLLRSGAFSGLRDNVRAVGQYAAEASSKDEGDRLVSGFFTSLQDLDYQLFSALREKRPVAEEASAKLQATIAALDDLLATIPEEDMVQARRIVQALQEAEYVAPQAQPSLQAEAEAQAQAAAP